MHRRILVPILFAAAIGAGCGNSQKADVADSPREAALEKREVPASASATLLATKQGGIALLEGFSLRDLPEIPYETTVVPGPKFIISDDPEYIRQPEGVALSEPLEPGNYRLYVYNVNGMKEPPIDRKISVVVENQGDGPMNIVFDRYSYRGPSGNYFGVAKNGLYDYFTRGKASDSPGTVVIPAGEAKPLDPRMESAIVKPDELVHTLHEFSVDQPGRLSVVQSAPGDSTVHVMKRSGGVIKSPRKNAGRGTFLTSNYSVRTTGGYTLDPSNGPVQLIVADGKTDPWVKGIDGSTGAELELKGNYGIMYDIEIERTAGDGRGLALVTWNYRFGSPWCGGSANCIVVSEGVHPAGPVLVPTEELMTKSEPEAVLIQLFPPLKPGETETIKVTYSPPGASCLPTPLVFIPVDFGAK